MKENGGGRTEGRPAVCPLPYKEAAKYGIDMLEMYLASQQENIRCAEAVKDAIRESGGSLCTDMECARLVAMQFGFERVNFVLAYNIQQDAGSISKRNFLWSMRTTVFPDEVDGADRRSEFRIPCCPAALDKFTDMVRELQVEPELFCEKQCHPINGTAAKGLLLVLKPEYLEEFCDTPDWQIVYCMDADEKYIDGISLKNGKPYHAGHDIFYGRLKEEYIPGWAAVWQDMFRECGTSGQTQENSMKMDF